MQEYGVGVLTVGNEYVLVGETEEDYIIKNDVGENHVLTKEDDEGYSYKTWMVLV